MLHLNAVRGIVPEERPTLFALSDRYAMSRPELMVFHRIYGLDRVPVWRESVTDLIASAVGRLVSEADVDPGRIKWLIHTHTGKQLVRVGDTLLHSVCRRLDLKHARTMGMTTNNCATTISAIQLIERLLDGADPEDRAVLVTADLAFTPIMQIVPQSSVTGDAAVACLFGREGPGHPLLASRVDVYGQHSRCQWQLREERAEEQAEYPSRLARTMSLTLERAGLNWGDVRWVIPHNVNVYSWRDVARRAGIPMSLIYLEQLPKLAHCFGADVFLNWQLADEDKRFAPGDYVLLATAGLGATFAASVLQYAG
jgi:3-oxoacyl-[acyl-carrier-protein] synthase-3